MGWQNETFLGKRILVGDEPIDRVHELLRAFGNCYTEEGGRKPTTDEFVHALSGALQTTGREVFADLENLEVTAVKLVTKKAPKICKFGVGDYFAIPLPNGEYGYGRILACKSVTVIEVYQVRSRNRLSLNRLKNQKCQVLLQTNVNGLAAFRSGLWPILGNEKVAPNHPMPSFRYGDRSTVWIINERGVPEEQAMKVEPVVPWAPETIVRRIMSDHPEICHEVEELNCQDFGDRYLKIIQYPAELEELYLRAPVSDAGLKRLAHCTNLKILDVLLQPITDAGLMHLAKLAALEELDLGRTQITDAGLVHLRGLKKLRKLGLKGTRATAKGIASLKKALPRLVVETE